MDRSVKTALLATLAITCQMAHAQTTYAPRPQGGDPTGTLDRQAPEFSAFQKCIADNRSVYQLYSATQELINARDQRRGTEYALKHDSRMAALYPGGYDQFLAAAFATYKSLGGRASSPAEVTPGINPCPPPSRRPPAPPDMGSSVRDSRTMPNVQQR